MLEKVRRGMHRYRKVKFLGHNGAAMAFFAHLLRMGKREMATTSCAALMEKKTINFDWHEQIQAL